MRMLSQFGNVLGHSIHDEQRIDYSVANIFCYNIDSDGYHKPLAGTIKLYDSIGKMYNQEVSYD